MKKVILTIGAIFVALTIITMIGKYSNSKTEKLLNEKGIILNQNTAESSEKNFQSLEETKKEKSEIDSLVDELRSGKSGWRIFENEEIAMNISIGNLLDSETGKVIDGKISSMSIACNKLDGSLTTMIKINGFTPAIDSRGFATVVYTMNIDGSDVEEAEGWTNNNLSGNQNIIETNLSNYAVEMLSRDLVTFGTKVNTNKFILTSFNLNGYAETAEPVLKACKIKF